MAQLGLVNEEKARLSHAAIRQTTHSPPSQYVFSKITADEIDLLAHVSIGN